MRLGVVGSRYFSDYERLSQTINKIRQQNTVELIISGGAKGADSLAEKYAEENGIQIKIFPAEWKRYGRAAGPIRNKLIVANSDIILAFLSSSSKGTRNTIEEAVKSSKEVIVKAL